MRFRASQAIITLVLITCLVCPLVELFDRWDHTMQTGNDTEYGLVVLALCIGAAYSLARFILKQPLFKSVREAISNLGARKLRPFGLRFSFFVSPIPLTPPGLALRI